MICNTFFRLKTLFLDSKRSSLRHFGDGWKNHNICAWRTWLENVKQLLIACCLYNRVIPKKMIIRNWCRGLSRAAARVFDLCLTFYIYTHYAVPQRKSIFHLGRLWRLWKEIVTFIGPCPQGGWGVIRLALKASGCWVLECLSIILDPQKVLVD